MEDLDRMALPVDQLWINMEKILLKFQRRDIHWGKEEGGRKYK